jgi:hypothetical protein
MLDYIAVLTAHQRVADGAREALPGSPVRPDDRGVILRHRIGGALHRFAERLDSQPVGWESTTTASCN